MPAAGNPTELKAGRTTWKRCLVTVGQPSRSTLHFLLSGHGGQRAGLTGWGPHFGLSCPRALLKPCSKMSSERKNRASLESGPLLQAPKPQTVASPTLAAPSSSRPGAQGGQAAGVHSPIALGPLAAGLLPTHVAALAHCAPRAIVIRAAPLLSQGCSSNHAVFLVTRTLALGSRLLLFPSPFCFPLALVRIGLGWTVEFASRRPQH